MEKIETVEALGALYGTPAEASLVKAMTRITPLYRAWIGASKFCILSTVGPEGTDATPRGDDGPVVLELTDTRLALPDWRGNNRLDALRNIVRDGRVSLVFFVAGSTTVVRVNGRGFVTADADLRARFDQHGKHPATVTVIDIDEIYTQCARALMRSNFWHDPHVARGELPSIGDFLAEATSGAFDGEAYDRDWPDRAAKFMW